MIQNSKQLVYKYIKSLKHKKTLKLFIVKNKYKQIEILIGENIPKEYIKLKEYSGLDFKDPESTSFNSILKTLQRVLAFGKVCPNLIIIK